MNWKAAILLSLGVGLLSAGLSVFLQAHSETLQGAGANSPALVPIATTSAAVSFGSSFEVPGKPVRLIIPAIGVNANIQSVGLFWSGDGDMSIPTNFTDVAWYNGGPRPGMPGSAVIDGHLDGRNVREAVFYNLGNLIPGDIVEVVDQGGSILQFQVIRLETYDYNATTSDIFTSNGSGTYLNLITCAGDWIKGKNIYNERVVVFTQLATTF